MVHVRCLRIADAVTIIHNFMGDTAYSIPH